MDRSVAESIAEWDDRNWLTPTQKRGLSRATIREREQALQDAAVAKILAEIGGAVMPTAEAPERTKHTPEQDKTIRNLLRRMDWHPATQAIRAHANVLRNRNEFDADAADRMIRRLAGLEYDGPFEDGVKCERCAGSGMFVTGVENGKLVGPGGACYRCGGKGKQTDCGHAAHVERAIRIAADDDAPRSACCDRVRNDLYDRYGIRIYAG